MVAEHLFRSGKYEVGCAFIQEAGLPRAQALTETCRELHDILQQVPGPSCSGAGFGRVAVITRANIRGY